jgi:hypothetical protein
MKLSQSLKAGFLTALFLLSSCATTKYSDDLYKNDYTKLKTGRTYSFSLKDSSKKQKMIFMSTDSENITGFVSSKDSTQVSLSKSNVTAVRDQTKARVTAGAVVIGAAAVGALVLSSTRATSN